MYKGTHYFAHTQINRQKSYYFLLFFLFDGGISKTAQGKTPSFSFIVSKWKSILIYLGDRVTLKLYILYIIIYYNI